MPHVDVRAVYTMYYNAFFLLFLGTGLFIKPLFVWRIKGFALGRLTATAATMIAASSLFLVAAIPVAMIICLLLNYWVLAPVFKTNESAPVVWLSVVSMIVGISAAVEAMVLRFVFAKRVSPRAFSLLCSSNAICMTATLYWLGEYMSAHPPMD